MQCFFSIIEKNKDKLDCPDLFLDRLYRRYVRPEEFDAAEAMMPQLRSIFSAIKTDKKLLRELGWKQEETTLDLSRDSLGDVFSFYFKTLEESIYMARRVYTKYGEYTSLRTGVVDIPDCMFDQIRPLSEYDALGSDDPPFWLR
jgi:hypothetical protein